MIADRRIAIDGKPVETPATLLNSLKGVTVDDKPVKPPAPARLFIFHKPPGVLTAANDPKGRPTIYNRLPDGLPRPTPAGRPELKTAGRPPPPHTGRPTPIGRGAGRERG